MKLLILILALNFLIETEAGRGYYSKFWRRYKKPKCDPVKCSPECELKDVPDSPCQICECKRTGEDIDDILDKGINGIDEQLEKPLCSPPKCPPGCEIDELSEPCPQCKCLDEVAPDEPDEKPLCSPPKCPPGCEIENDFDGPCPGCKCREEKEPEPKGIGLACDPVKCMPWCLEKKDRKGCPFCDCEKICDPPKCGPGCKIEDDPKRPCPGCVCKEEEKVDESGEKKVDEDKIEEKVDEDKIEEKVDEGKIEEKVDEDKIEEKVIKDCPPIEEDCKKPGCTLRVDEKGCDVCKCEPICDPPKCPRRCRIEKNEGECPKCVCPKFRYGR